MLDFDVSVVQRLMADRPNFTWIDLGCGSGELQRRVSPRYGFALGIDAEPGMAKFWPPDSRSWFLCSPIEGLTLSARVDLVTAFGLVTCLSPESEEALLKLARNVSGRFILKHQVSRASEFVVDGYSKDLGTHYWGRYPSFDSQLKFLKTVWPSVKVVRYPDFLNRHANSFHAAFVCEVL